VKNFNDENKNSFPKQPQQQRQNRADNQARHDGKMKTEIAFGIIDIARQTAKPAFAETGPKQRAGGGDEQTGDD
jgi:hypothetical protein